MREWVIGFEMEAGGLVLVMVMVKWRVVVLVVVVESCNELMQVGGAL